MRTLEGGVRFSLGKSEQSTPHLVVPSGAARSSRASFGVQCSSALSSSREKVICQQSIQLVQGHVFWI